MKKRQILNILFLLFVITFFGCSEEKTPKPYGHIRIDYVENDFVEYTENCPFKFSVPKSASVTNKDNQYGTCHKNIVFNDYNATLHCSYFPLDSSGVLPHSEAIRDLAYNHSIKAQSIDAKEIYYPDHKVYGIAYEITGDVASNLVFYVTDSTSHLFHGSLYFNASTHWDSVQPVVEYLFKDINKMIETFEWKNSFSIPQPELVEKQLFGTYTFNAPLNSELIISEDVVEIALNKEGTAKILLSEEKYERPISDEIKSGRLDRRKDGIYSILYEDTHNEQQPIWFEITDSSSFHLYGSLKTPIYSTKDSTFAFQRHYSSFIAELLKTFKKER